MMHNGFGSGHYSSWMCGPGMFLPGPFGWIVSLLFWGLLIFLAVKLYQAFFSKQRAGGAGATSLDGLKDRYARGYISEDEYRRMKVELDG